MKALVVSGKKILIICSAFFVLAGAVFIINLFFGSTAPTSSQVESGQMRTINLVTGEFKAEKEDGQVIETYRFDPGTIFVKKGELFKLSIYGVNGHEHPFTVEGTDKQGVVKQGSETVLDLQFDEEGIYRVICNTHTTTDTEGPMVAHIVVGD
ncbi:cupredoxin domain-containing protein [Halobacillus sp. A1]|uniref:cupredoxin domain-containing protein n=1 Tax=Halobacillus sp. A1 TaxID=2880262 RepID=UPI0020A6A8B3|nr:cupredoxin domain-containing protein [Halobacillus sp. A1]MCP3030935.1 cupredoxin domain-containing protein [Halobacillus sp. A1]